jgi:flagellar hook assembly protein FlgD
MAGKNVTLSVYDVRGRLMATLFRGPAASGYHRVVWNGSDADGRRLSSGVYVYRLEMQGKVMEQRMVMVK